MKQILRRVTYLLFGLQPALIGTAISLFFFGPLAIMAIAGTFGLTIAMATEFPISRRTYWIMAALLICGLVLTLPIFIWMLLEVVTEAGLTKSLTNTVFVSWVILGPVTCAIHALWRSRRAPNNSFKPTPLRGAA